MNSIVAGHIGRLVKITGTRGGLSDVSGKLIDADAWWVIVEPNDGGVRRAIPREQVSYMELL